MNSSETSIFAWCRHAPAGWPVALASHLPTVQGPLWGSSNVLFTSSGTCALALAVQAALAASKDVNPGRRVQLPAYACPDLLAAVVWAQGVPEFLDVDPESLETPQAAHAGVKVVVDAFGAGVSTVDENPFRIVDLAQSYAAYEEGWVPASPWCVVSFGRAKPLTLTGGGALISESCVSAQGLKSARPPNLLRRGIYNLSLNPTIFGALSRLPFLGIGKTAYSPLESARSSPELRPIVERMVESYRANRDVRLAATSRVLEVALDSGCRIPSVVQRAAASRPLWRMPLICPNQEAAAEARQFGAFAGITRLYGRVLPQFLEAGCDTTMWPGARLLAERLITLPTHGRLSRREIQRLGQLLRSIN